MNSIFSEEIQQEMMAQIVNQVSKTLSVMAADKQNKRYLRYSKEALHIVACRRELSTLDN